VQVTELFYRFGNERPADPKSNGRKNH